MGPTHPVVVELITLLREVAPALATLAEARISNDRDQEPLDSEAGLKSTALDSDTPDGGMRALDMIQKAVIARLGREVLLAADLARTAERFELTGVDLVGSDSEVVIDLTSPIRMEALAEFQGALMALIDNAREVIRGQT